MLETNKMVMDMQLRKDFKQDYYVNQSRPKRDRQTIQVEVDYELDHEGNKAKKDVCLQH